MLWKRVFREVHASHNRIGRHQEFVAVWYRQDSRVVADTQLHLGRRAKRRQVALNELEFPGRHSAALKRPH